MPNTARPHQLTETSRSKGAMQVWKDTERIAEGKCSARKRSEDRERKRRAQQQGKQTIQQAFAARSKEAGV